MQKKEYLTQEESETNNLEEFTYCIFGKIREASNPS